MTNRIFARQAQRAALVAFAVLVAWLALGVGGARGAAFDPHRVIVGYRSETAVTVAGDAEIRMGMRSAAPAPAPRARVLDLPAGESVASAVARLRRQAGVAYADPDYIAHATGDFYPDDRGRANRPQGWEQMQWNMLPGYGINAPEAWGNLIADHRAGGHGVVIAVLDTGVAYRNWNKFRESPDFKGTRFVSPYDFVSNNRYPLDRNGHGTFVAGVLAEATNNGFGLTGLAYGASIMPVRVLDSQGEGDEGTIARGIRYAVQHGAQVINLSLEFLPNQVTSGNEIPAIVNAIDYAHRRGVTVVGAAGNDETNQIAYPARVPTVIAVGATTRDRCIADYSNSGSALDLVAPGGGDDAIMPSDPDCQPQLQLPSIYQLTLTDPPHWSRFGYPNYYIGTSMASPEVAGTAALVIASGVIGRHPTPDQILTRLEQTATPLPLSQTPPGSPVVPHPNATYGYGLVNAGAATAPATAPAGAPTP
jgi:serine protease